MKTIKYLGGYELADKAKLLGKLEFTPEGVIASNPFGSWGSLRGGEAFRIPAEEIVDVAIEGESEVNRRVTMTRLLTVGIFALAAKKKSRHATTYVTVTTREHGEAIFEIGDEEPKRYQAKVSAKIAAMRRAAAV
jgi:hypothetical protein